MSRLVNVVKLGVALCVLIVLGASWTSIRESMLSDAKADSTRIDKLKLLPGFKAEHLYSPSDNKQGSWVAMAFDDKGRMITSDQYGFLYRLELPVVGSGVQRPRVEKLKVGEVQPGDTTVGMGYAQGLLYAFNSLYVMVNNRENKNFGKGSGLYRLQDTNGDDQFDKITLLKALKGEGEHGPHSVVLSPDKQSIYVVAGNHTDVPTMDAYRLPSNWKEDNLFPLIKDPRGHANDRMAPGGWIAKVDPEGKTWELIGAGFRNAFDIAFNEAGDMFTYDSDMEWDFGLPWYRPTRICHVTSGAEFGWRTGNSKWLPANPDNLPPVLNIGQGSPTNLIYGQNARFPQKYRQSLFAFDWSFGIIYSIHLKPKGASYEAERDEFVSGSPLPLTDGMIGPDGALYFLTGGRRLESDLYRISYPGADNAAAAAPTLTKEHQLRTQLERYHGKPDAAALALAWPNLNHPDRFVRYAARIAVEHQPVSQWQEKALAEMDPQRSTQAIIAMARQGDATLKNKLLTSLLRIKYDQLSEAQQFDLMRAFELVFLRMGAPEPAEKDQVVAYLNPRYPAKTALLNRGLSKLLVYLEAPSVVEKTLALMSKKDEAGSHDLGLETSTASSDLILRNPQYGLDIAKMLEKVPPLQQTYYATMLSREKTGWNPKLRDQYFSWFAKAFTYQGGRSYIGFIDKARKLALANVPKEQVAQYDKLSGADLLTRSGNDIATDYTPKGPYRNWKLENAVAVVDSGLVGRNFETGRKIYSAVLCSRCHSMGGQGGDIGPDLTQLGTRFSNKDILEAIIEPNKTVSDQYASTIFTLRNGQSVLGRVISEDKVNYSISQNPFASDQLRKVPKKDVVSKKNSTESIMLPGLINSLGSEELKDLVAYLKSGGNQANEVYKHTDSGKGNNASLDMIKKTTLLAFVALTSLAMACVAQPKKAAKGFVSIFDGKTLNGWEGDPTYWRVENGALVGEITPSTLLKTNSFIIWKGGEPADFELTGEFNITENGNSGINYRSDRVADVPFALRGYQADIDGKIRYTGQNYEERKRTTLAYRGQKTVIPAYTGAATPEAVRANVKNNAWGGLTVTGSLGNSDSLKTFIKSQDWNTFHLVIKGNRLQHYINDVLMSDVTDDDTVNGMKKGLLGVQVHVGPPMKVQYRNLMLKTL